VAIKTHSFIRKEGGREGEGEKEKGEKKGGKKRKKRRNPSVGGEGGECSVITTFYSPVSVVFNTDIQREPMNNESQQGPLVERTPQIGDFQLMYR
jgi:hypothetical protein